MHGHGGISTSDAEQPPLRTEAQARQAIVSHDKTLVVDYAMGSVRDPSNPSGGLTNDSGEPNYAREFGRGYSGL